MRGEPPPPELKVSLTTLGGFRNEMEFVLTGLDIDAKAELVRANSKPGCRCGRPNSTGPSPAPTTPTPTPRKQASALLRCVVRDPDPNKVGRAFANVAVELALASYPGCNFTTPPGNGSALRRLHPGVRRRETSSPQSRCCPTERAARFRRRTTRCRSAPVAEPALPRTVADRRRHPRARSAPIALARSGDKGGDANVGVWVRTDEQWRWLAHTLTVDLVRKLLPETADLPITRHVLPNLRAVNFVIEGMLGAGRGVPGAVRPAGQGARRMAASAPRRHTGGVLVSIWHTPEREQLRETVRGFVEREVLPDLDDWERDGELPRELHKKAGESSACSASRTPRTVGGAGGDGVDAVIVCEEMHHAGASGGVFASLFTCGIAVPHLIAAGDRAQIDTLGAAHAGRRTDRIARDHRTRRRVRRRASSHHGPPRRRRLHRRRRQDLHHLRVSRRLRGDRGPHRRARRARVCRCS